jgi:selenium-binding protein 1
MAHWTPDPTVSASPREAMRAPRERLAYTTVTLNTGAAGARSPDALCALDVDPGSATYGDVVGRVEMPHVGDELHDFGWNACSAALCPAAARHHMERRYLVVPGLRSSRIHVLDTRPDPRRPRLVKVVDPAELAARTGYSRPHTARCGPDGIYLNALGAPGGGGPGGLFVLDHDTFSVRGRWEAGPGPQHLAYDFAWHLGHDALLTSEWGTPDTVEGGLDPELLRAGAYGHRLHVWGLRSRTHLQALDLGPEQQLVLGLRPAHDPNQTYGFAGVAISRRDLSASVWPGTARGASGGCGR